MVVAPIYVLFPLNVLVPSPDLVRLPEPWIMPLNEEVEEELVVNVVELAISTVPAPLK